MKWEPTSLQYLVSSAVDGPFGSSLTSAHYSDGGARVIRLGNIGDGHWRDDEAYIPLEYARELRRHGARHGDVVVAGLGDANNPLGRAVVVPDIGPAIVKADCFRLRLRADKLEPRFFVYYMSGGGSDEARRRAHGSTRQRLPLGEVLSLPVPVPPLEEQRRIADYLDIATARIDTLLTKNAEAAALVAERRVAAYFAIVEAARGPMAAVWQVAGGVTSGPRDWGDYVDFDGERPFVRITNIPRDSFTISRDDLLYVTPPPGDGQSDRVQLRTGDVVVSITADIGSVAVVDEKLTGSAFNQHVARIRPTSDLDPFWLALCLRTVGRPQFEQLTAGGTKLGLSLSDVRSIRIPQPAFAIQKRAVQQARESASWSELMLGGLAEQAELLRERRQALITAAVSGEIEV